jgi:hypothetical protein
MLAESSDHNSDIILKQINIVGDNTAGANGMITGSATGGSVANKSVPTTVSMAGVNWTQESADIAEQGVTLHMVVLVGTHNGSTYLIGYISLKSKFSSANTSYFQPILHSYKFTD